MTRRVVVCCLLLVLGGRTVGFPDAGSPTGERPTSTPTLEHEMDPPGGPTPVMSAQVDLRGSSAPPVRVVATDRQAGRTVVNATYEGAFTADFDDETALEPERGYKFTIRTGGEIAWQETVRHYERYDLYVTANGTVQVESYVVS